MEEKTLTKWSLCARVIRRLLKITLLFWIMLTVLFIVASIGSLTLMLFIQGVMLALALAVTGTIIMLLPFNFMVLWYFLNIKKQERYFGFKLSDEMKKENITSVPYKSKIWYIDEEYPLIIALRKDYIKSIGNVKYSSTYTRGSRRSSGKVTLITVDGKKIKYYGSGIAILKFVKWLSFQSHVK